MEDGLTCLRVWGLGFEVWVLLNPALNTSPPRNRCTGEPSIHGGCRLRRRPDQDQVGGLGLNVYPFIIYSFIYSFSYCLPIYYLPILGRSPLLLKLTEVPLLR